MEELVLEDTWFNEDVEFTDTAQGIYINLL